MATLAQTSSIPVVSEENRLRDSHGRAIVDLRLSVTDRCNYRCVYCRDQDSMLFGELTMEQYLRLAQLFVSLGIEKIRLTGGEPLLRRNLIELIQSISSLTTLTGAPVEVALTTNGHLLADLAVPLKQAGLSRITISMDAVEPVTFERVTRVPGSFHRVLQGVRAAKAAGLDPIKVNCVLLRGFNEDQIEGFAHFAREEDVIVRFIEFMPLEEGRVWSPEIVVSEKEIVERIGKVLPLVPLAPNHLSETARRYAFADGKGEIGIIAPVSRPFCNHCSRIRLTSDGKIRTCLFSQSEHDLASLLQRDATDLMLSDFIRRTVEHKEARHHIGEEGFLKPSRSMVHIGG